MKIGVIASIAHRLPPPNDGSWEQVAATLTDGFVARGHNVTLFATANSQTAAWLHGTVPAGYADDRQADARVCAALHHAAVFERASEFDVLVNHSDFLPLSYSRLVSTPMVTTIRGFSSPQVVPVYRAYDDIARYVAVSASDRHPDLHYAATIHYGIDTNRFTFVPDAGGYLLALGRIHPDKVYFRDAVQPHIDGVAVSHIEAPGPAQRNALLGGARALVHLISVGEPFSLCVVEALATGTPVIATPLGSVPELLRDTATGFLVSDAAAAVVAVAKVGDLDRQLCRDDATSRFGVDRMVDDYLALFDRILGARRPRHPGSIQSVGSPGLFSHATN